VQNALQDPLLELHDGNGAIVVANDNWKYATNAAEISATGIPPSGDREAAIVTTLAPSNSGYTAVVRGREWHDRRGAGGSLCAELKRHEP
jgi:hypothetical protein